MADRLGSIRRRVFGIDPLEASVSRRGFDAPSPEVRRRLESIGASFLHGYHAALRETHPDPLAARLRREVDPELTGFAFEGASMALALLDLLPVGRSDRLVAFLRGPARDHHYMVQVGVGWAVARLRRSPRAFLRRLDPLTGWLLLDGFGFHEGYFHWKRTVEAREVPEPLSGYERRAFDQGLGRSLWFVDGAQVARIRTHVDSFAAERRADLWAGVGLAAAYAGGIERGGLDELAVAAGPFRAHAAQGAAFAAKARARAGNMAPHTDEACCALCGVAARDAAVLCDVAAEGLSAPSGSVVPAAGRSTRDAQHDAARFRPLSAGHRRLVRGDRSGGIESRPPDYEVWRARLCAHFETSLEGQHQEELAR